MNQKNHYASPRLGYLLRFQTKPRYIVCCANKAVCVHGVSGSMMGCWCNLFQKDVSKTRLFNGPTRRRQKTCMRCQNETPGQQGLSDFSRLRDLEFPKPKRKRRPWVSPYARRLKRERRQKKRLERLKRKMQQAERNRKKLKKLKKRILYRMKHRLEGPPKTLRRMSIYQPRISRTPDWGRPVIRLGPPSRVIAQRSVLPNTLARDWTIGSRRPRHWVKSRMNRMLNVQRISFKRHNRSWRDYLKYLYNERKLLPEKSEKIRRLMLRWIRKRPFKHPLHAMLTRQRHYKNQVLRHKFTAMANGSKTKTTKTMTKKQKNQRSKKTKLLLKRKKDGVEQKAGTILKKKKKRQMTKTTPLQSTKPPCQGDFVAEQTLKRKGKRKRNKRVKWNKALPGSLRTKTKIFGLDKTFRFRRNIKKWVYDSNRIVRVLEKYQKVTTNDKPALEKTKSYFQWLYLLWLNGPGSKWRRLSNIDIDSWGQDNPNWRRRQRKLYLELAAWDAREQEITKARGLYEFAKTWNFKTEPNNKKSTPLALAKNKITGANYIPNPSNVVLKHLTLDLLLSGPNDMHLWRFHGDNSSPFYLNLVWHPGWPDTGRIEHQGTLHRKVSDKKVSDDPTKKLHRTISDKTVSDDPTKHLSSLPATLKPVKKGLFCLEAFGPEPVKHPLSPWEMLPLRRMQPGFIDLPCPMVNHLFLKRRYPYLSRSLVLSQEKVERTVYTMDTTFAPLETHDFNNNLDRPHALLVNDWVVKPWPKYLAQGLEFGQTHAFWLGRTTDCLTPGLDLPDLEGLFLKHLCSYVATRTVGHRTKFQRSSGWHYTQRPSHASWPGLDTDDFDWMGYEQYLRRKKYPKQWLAEYLKEKRRRQQDITQRQTDMHEQNIKNEFLPGRPHVRYTYNVRPYFVRELIPEDYEKKNNYTFYGILHNPKKALQQALRQKSKHYNFMFALAPETRGRCYNQMTTARPAQNQRQIFRLHDVEQLRQRLKHITKTDPTLVINQYHWWLKQWKRLWASYDSPMDRYHMFTFFHDHYLIAPGPWIDFYYGAQSEQTQNHGLVLDSATEQKPFQGPFVPFQDGFVPKQSTPGSTQCVTPAQPTLLTPMANNSKSMLINISRNMQQSSVHPVWTLFQATLNRTYAQHITHVVVYQADLKPQVYRRTHKNDQDPEKKYEPTYAMVKAKAKTHLSSDGPWQLEPMRDEIEFIDPMLKAFYCVEHNSQRHKRSLGKYMHLETNPLMTPDATDATHMDNGSKHDMSPEVSGLENKGLLKSDEKSSLLQETTRQSRSTFGPRSQNQTGWMLHGHKLRLGDRSIWNRQTYFTKIKQYYNAALLSPDVELTCLNHLGIKHWLTDIVPTRGQVKTPCNANHYDRRVLPSTLYPFSNKNKCIESLSTPLSQQWHTPVKESVTWCPKTYLYDNDRLDYLNFTLNIPLVPATYHTELRQCMLPTHYLKDEYFDGLDEGGFDDEDFFEDEENVDDEEILARGEMLAYPTNESQWIDSESWAGDYWVDYPAFPFILDKEEIKERILELEEIARAKARARADERERLRKLGIFVPDSDEEEEKDPYMWGGYLDDPEGEKNKDLTTGWIALFETDSTLDQCYQWFDRWPLVHTVEMEPYRRVDGMHWKYSLFWPDTLYFTSDFPFYWFLWSTIVKNSLSQVNFRRRSENYLTPTWSWSGHKLKYFKPSFIRARTDSDTVPTDSDTVPTDFDTVPTDSDTVPTDSDTVPTSDQDLKTHPHGTKQLNFFLCAGLDRAKTLEKALQANPNTYSTHISHRPPRFQLTLKPTSQTQNYVQHHLTFMHHVLNVQITLGYLFINGAYTISMQWNLYLLSEHLLTLATLMLETRVKNQFIHALQPNTNEASTMDGVESYVLQNIILPLQNCQTHGLNLLENATITSVCQNQSSDPSWAYRLETRRFQTNRWGHPSGPISFRHMLKRYFAASLKKAYLIGYVKQSAQQLVYTPHSNLERFKPKRVWRPGLSKKTTLDEKTQFVYFFRDLFMPHCDMAFESTLKHWQRFEQTQLKRLQQCYSFATSAGHWAYRMHTHALHDAFVSLPMQSIHQNVLFCKAPEVSTLGARRLKAAKPKTWTTIHKHQLIALMHHYWCQTPDVASWKTLSYTASALQWFTRQQGKMQKREHTLTVTNKPSTYMAYTQSQSKSQCYDKKCWMVWRRYLHFFKQYPHARRNPYCVAPLVHTFDFESPKKLHGLFHPHLFLTETSKGKSQSQSLMHLVYENNGPFKPIPTDPPVRALFYHIDRGLRYRTHQGGHWPWEPHLINKAIISTQQSIAFKTNLWYALPTIKDPLQRYFEEGRNFMKQIDTYISYGRAMGKKKLLSAVEYQNDLWTLNKTPYLDWSDMENDSEIVDDMESDSTESDPMEIQALETESLDEMGEIEAMHEMEPTESDTMDDTEIDETDYSETEVTSDMENNIENDDESDDDSDDNSHTKDMDDELRDLVRKIKTIRQTGTRRLSRWEDFLIGPQRKPAAPIIRKMNPRWDWIRKFKNALKNLKQKEKHPVSQWFLQPEDLNGFVRGTLIENPLVSSDEKALTRKENRLRLNSETYPLLIESTKQRSSSYSAEFFDAQRVEHLSHQALTEGHQLVLTKQGSMLNVTYATSSDIVAFQGPFVPNSTGDIKDGNFNVTMGGSLTLYHDSSANNLGWLQKERWSTMGQPWKWVTKTPPLTLSAMLLELWFDPLPNLFKMGHLEHYAPSPKLPRTQDPDLFLKYTAIRSYKRRLFTNEPIRSIMRTQLQSEFKPDFYGTKPPFQGPFVPFQSPFVPFQGGLVSFQGEAQWFSYDRTWRQMRPDTQTLDDLFFNHGLNEPEPVEQNKVKLRSPRPLRSYPFGFETHCSKRTPRPKRAPTPGEKRASGQRRNFQKIKSVVQNRCFMGRRLKMLRPWFNETLQANAMLITKVPVLPPDMRPVLVMEGDHIALSDINKFYAQVLRRNTTLRRMLIAFSSISEDLNYFAKEKKRIGALRQKAYKQAERNPKRTTLEKRYRFYAKDHCENVGSLTHHQASLTVLRTTDKSLTIAYCLRWLQRAINNLVENGKSGFPPVETGSVENRSRRPMRSIADMLKGKKGRFRQNLLGKRVDYSGRSVIVVGPELKLHQCGLPEDMAFTLFRSFLIRHLIHCSDAVNMAQAKHMIDLRHPAAYQRLREVLANRPVLLNRAPTLHRLGVQAFQPQLVTGRAILLHPLVCSAFNADFDGDQMAVHVPISVDACMEAWHLMWSCHQHLSMASGEAVMVPSQDMVLGCFWISTFDPLRRFETLQTRPWSLDPDFNSKREVYNLYFDNQIGLQCPIWLYCPTQFTMPASQCTHLLQMSSRGNIVYLHQEYKVVRDLDVLLSIAGSSNDADYPGVNPLDPNQDQEQPYGTCAYPSEGGKVTSEKYQYNFCSGSNTQNNVRIMEQHYMTYLQNLYNIKPTCFIKTSPGRVILNEHLNAQMDSKPFSSTPVPFKSMNQHRFMAV